MFATARGFAKQSWRNLVDSKYETISVGLVGLGMGAGWTVLLSRVTLFNEETDGSSWLTAPDSTLSCRESGGKSLGYLFRSYAPVVPATVAFVTLRSRTVPWPKLKALISTKGWEYVPKGIAALGLAFVPVSYFSPRPATLCLNQVKPEEFTLQQDLTLFNSNSNSFTALRDYKRYGYGVFRISRQPEHIPVCLGALAAAASCPNPATLLFFSLYPAYAWLSSQQQDQRDIYRIDSKYFENTSNVPFAAILAGRNSLSEALVEIKPSQWIVSAVLASIPFLA